MKLQFGEHLYEMKFVDSKDIKSESANRNSKNEALVRAVICAGLYPNVAEVRTFQVICERLYPNVAEVINFQVICEGLYPNVAEVRTFQVICERLP